MKLLIAKPEKKPIKACLCNIPKFCELNARHKRIQFVGPQEAVNHCIMMLNLVFSDPAILTKNPAGVTKILTIIKNAGADAALAYILPIINAYSAKYNISFTL